MLLVLAAPSYAQVLPIGDDDGTTTTTSTTTTSTTTTTAPEDDGAGTPTSQPGLLDDGGSTTTTTTTTTAPPSQEEPQPEQSPAAPGDESTPAPEGAGTGEDGDGTAGQPSGSRTIPPEAKSIMDSVQRTSASNTKALYAATQELVDLGLSPEEAIRIGFGRFPVGGVANYVHDWLYPRWGPGFRFHLGTDIFAPYGTPVRAPVDGTVTSGNGSLGGLYTKVHMDDGTYFYFAHLSGLPDGFVSGAEVKTGEVIGYVGTSGNAKGTPPHLHFSVYPQGGDPVDPKPILDRWIAEALDAIPATIEQIRTNRPAAQEAPAAATPRTARPLLASSLLRPLLEERADGGLSTAVLLETVGNPSSGGLAVAESEAEALVAGIDWNAMAASEQSRRRFVEETVEKTEALLRIALGPLAPTPTS